MNHFKFLFPLCMVGSVALAQDSVSTLLPMPEVHLQTITIQSYKQHGLIEEYKRDASLQQPVEKMLSQIKGVHLIRRGNFAWEPTIRGLNGGQINTTIDGMFIFGACTDKMDPVSSYVEPANLHQVQVAYGPNAQEAGSGIGGGFNFQLLKARPDSGFYTHGTLALGLESNAPAMQTIATLQMGDKRWAVGANAVFRKGGNYSMGGGKEVDFSQYSKWNAGINTTYQLSKHHQLTAAYLQDEGYNIGYPALTMDVAFAKAKIASLTHTYICGHRSLYRWENKVYYNFIDHAMDDTKRPQHLVPMHMDMPGKSRTIGAYSKAALRLNDHSVFNVQLNAYQNRLHAEMTMYPDVGAPMFMLTIPDAERNSLGLQVSNKYGLTRFWDIEAGFRLDYIISRVYTQLGEETLSGMTAVNLRQQRFLGSAFLQSSWQLGNTWQLFAGLAKAAREATLQERFGFYLYNRMDGFDYLGNVELDPERSWNFNVGMQMNKQHWDFQLTGFAYLFQDYISGIQRPDYSVMTIGAKGVKQYINLGNAQLFGLEFEANYSPFEGLLMSTTQTYAYGVDADGDALPLISPLCGLYKAAYTFHGFHLGFDIRHQSVQNHVATEKYGELPSEAFVLLHAHIGKTWSWKQKVFDLNFRVENITDRKYYEHLDLMKLPRPGRNFLFQVSYSF